MAFAILKLNYSELNNLICKYRENYSEHLQNWRFHKVRKKTNDLVISISSYSNPELSILVSGRCAEAAGVPGRSISGPRRRRAVPRDSASVLVRRWPWPWLSKAGPPVLLTRNPSRVPCNRLHRASPFRRPWCIIRGIHRATMTADARSKNTRGSRQALGQIK